MTAGRTNHTMFASAPKPSERPLSSQYLQQVMRAESEAMARVFAVPPAYPASFRVAFDQGLAALKLILPTLAGLKYVEDASYGKNFSPSRAEKARKQVDAVEAAVWAMEQVLRAESEMMAKVFAVPPERALDAAPEHFVPAGAIYVTDTGHAWDAKGNPEMADDPNVEMFVPFYPGAPCSHELWKTGDAARPPAICDRNGEVVLSMCKKCGKVEAELDAARERLARAGVPSLADLVSKLGDYDGPEVSGRLSKGTP